MSRKILKGEVVSDKGDKTIVVSVGRIFLHPKIGKTVRRRKKYHAHDPLNKAKKGDFVVIEESSPISKKKRWRLVELVESVA